MINLFLNIILLFSTPVGIENNVLEYLQQKVDGYQKIEVVLLGNWDKYNRLKIEDDKEPRISGSIAYIPVSYTSDKGVKNTTLAVEIKLYDEVLVAVSNINRNEELNAKDFEIKLVEITTVKDPVKSYSLLVNKISREFIRKDEILSENLFIEKPVVNVGDRVKAHSIVGQVDINMPAVVRQAGYEGEVIRIRTADKNLFKAKVMDRNNVLIIE